MSDRYRPPGKSSAETARERAYAAAARIRFDGMRLRDDIGRSPAPAGQRRG